MRPIVVLCVCLPLLFVGAGAGSQESSPEVQALQKEMLGSPEIMALILSLQNDPDVQKVLADPMIMKAIGAGDVNTLMASPAFMRIMEKQAVRDIGGKLGR